MPTKQKQMCNKLCTFLNYFFFLHFEHLKCIQRISFIDAKVIAILCFCHRLPVDVRCIRYFISLWHFFIIQYNLLTLSFSLYLQIQRMSLSTIAVRWHELQLTWLRVRVRACSKLWQCARVFAHKQYVCNVHAKMFRNIEHTFTVTINIHSAHNIE